LIGIKMIAIWIVVLLVILSVFLAWWFYPRAVKEVPKQPPPPPPQYSFPVTEPELEPEYTTEPPPFEAQVEPAETLPFYRQLGPQDPPRDHPKEIEQISDKIKYDEVAMPYDLPAPKISIRPNAQTMADGLQQHGVSSKAGPALFTSKPLARRR
jgi:cytoskeletal protein RodZ